MLHRALALTAVLSLAASGLASEAAADAICKRKNGVLRMRPTCKANEQTLPIAIEDDGKLVVIKGANVQIVDGSGDTDGRPTASET